MKSIKRILLCVVFIMVAFTVGKVDPTYAMQTLDLRMLPDTGGYTKLEELCEYNIAYSRGDEVRSFTDDYGETYRGDVITLNVPEDGKVSFFHVGGYSTSSQEIRLFSDNQLTNEVWNMNSVKSYMLGKGNTISKNLKKGTYYLFNGTSNPSQVGGWADSDGNVPSTYTLQAAYLVSGTAELKSGNKYTFTGDTGYGKIVLDNSQNISIITKFLGDVKVLNSSKKELYSLNVKDSVGENTFRVFLKKGTYYVKFEPKSYIGYGPDSFSYGYISYKKLSWSDYKLSDAKNVKAQKGIPVAFRYKPSFTGYITLSSPHNYDALIEMYDSSFNKIGKTDYTDGCSNQKACFVVEKGKTYYIKATLKMVYCDEFIKLNYSKATKSSCWADSRAGAKKKSAISGTVKGVWQYGCTKPLWVKVKKPNDYQALLIYLDLNRYSKCTVQAYNSKGKLVKISKGTGRYTKLSFSRTKSGWGHEGLYIYGKKGTYSLKITPVDGACGKLKLKPVPKR